MSVLHTIILLFALTIGTKVLVIFFPFLDMLVGINKSILCFTLFFEIRKHIVEVYKETMAYLYFVGLLQYADKQEDFMQPDMKEVYEHINKICLFLSLIIAALVL